MTIKTVQNVQKTPLPRLLKSERMKIIEDNYGLFTLQEISLQCGTSLKTIWRQITKWKQSKEYDEWLDEKWHRLLASDTVDDTTKFIQLTKLKEKRITQKIAQEVAMTVKEEKELNPDDYSDDEFEELKHVADIIERRANAKLPS